MIFDHNMFVNIYDLLDEYSSTRLQPLYLPDGYVNVLQGAF